MRDKAQLRADIRHQRRVLSAQQNELASSRICKLVADSAWFQESQYIGCYLSNDGEINLKELIDKIWKLCKQCYLPVLEPGGVNRLHFVLYTPETKLSPNRYGILEPVSETKEIQSTPSLDLICLPLVAFDDKGNRMGMGKGYYDRTLEFLNVDPRPQKPKLIGMAHHFQRVGELNKQAWDVPLDAVATEKKLTIF